MKQKKNKSRQGFQNWAPELTTEVYALKYMIIRFYGREPQGPKCLSVNNGLQGKAKVWVMYSVSTHGKKKGEKQWRQEIIPLILTVEPWIAANALWGQRQLTPSVEIQLSRVKTRTLSLSSFKNLRWYEKTLVNAACPPLTHGQFISRNHMVYCAG